MQGLHVCFTGVESTGKTRLAERLSRRLGGVLMPEYGREYAETTGTDFTPDVLRTIARIHAERRHRLQTARPHLLIEETDVVMTAAWFRMLHGHRDPVLSAMPAVARAMAAARATSWSIGRPGTGRTWMVASRATEALQPAEASATSCAAPAVSPARNVMMAMTSR